MIYKNLIRPVLLKNQRAIDGALNKVESKVTDATDLKKAK